MPDFDGLAEADVVGDEQVDAGHLDGADHRVELVVLDFDAAAEGCLQCARIRLEILLPTNRISGTHRASSARQNQ